VSAFEALYDRHHRMAFSLARHMVGSDRAEDVTQTAFFSIWKGSKTYRPERGSVKNWMLGCVRYRAIDVIRKEKASANAGTVPWSDDGTSASLSEKRATGPSAESIVLVRDAQRSARDAVEAVSGDQGLALQLAFFAGLSHSQIARELHLPVGTVKGRIRLGLEKLRHSPLITPG